jgi:PcfJ-like protein
LFLMFSVKGRTLASLTRQVQAWHVELAKYGNVDDTVFGKSGFKKGTWEFAKVTRKGAYYDRAVWSIAEILTARDLAEEGRRMNHCVYSYRRLIEEGKISIWSLTKDSEPMLTVELDHQAQAIIEALGKHNRLATAPELNVLKHWAQENSLAVRV